MQSLMAPSPAACTAGNGSEQIRAWHVIVIVLLVVLQLPYTSVHCSGAAAVQVGKLSSCYFNSGAAESTIRR